jgi:hypothetical protein
MEDSRCQATPKGARSYNAVTTVTRFRGPHLRVPAASPEMTLAGWVRTTQVPHLGQVTHEHAMRSAIPKIILPDPERPRCGGLQDSVRLRIFSVRSLGANAEQISQETRYGNCLRKRCRFFEDSATSTPLWISDVQHATFLKVDEEGTETAAATSIAMPTMSMRPTIPQFHMGG